jgi:hypothetical protein
MNAEVGKVKGEADVIFFDAAGTLIYLARPVCFSGSLASASSAPSLNWSASRRRSSLVAGTRPRRAADRISLGCQD